MTDASTDFILDPPQVKALDKIHVNVAVRLNDKSFCSLRHLTSLGLPARVGPSKKHPTEGYCLATYAWIMNNWPTDANLMGYLRQLQEKAARERKLTVFVSSGSFMSVARALRKALLDSDAALNHTFQSLNGNKTIAGTAGPVSLNNTLGELSYVERKKLAEQIQARLEEVPQSEQ